VRATATQTVILTLLAVVFAIALTYATIALPRAINKSLQGSIEFPGYDPGHQTEQAEAWYEAYHVRSIGYTALAVVFVFIVVGFVAERGGLASAGAIVLFLPVFGHFAMSMFFLASLGLLRVVWMPFLDISPDILKLGDIAYVPYMAMVWPPAAAGIDVRGWISWLIMGIGMLVFTLGVVAWSQTKLAKGGTTDFWVYRFSRHPQYLGWIVWSYGLFIYMTDHIEANFKLTWHITHSLPWLLSTLVIIGVALVEELRMKRTYGSEYESYMRRAPFLLPLPRWLSNVLAAPARLVLRHSWPRSGREVLLVIAAYAVLLVLLSLPFLLFHWPPRGGWWAYPYNVYPFR
jgi:protein-S-isoprenylcysteine O-methyltransferase Ste14